MKKIIMLTSLAATMSWSAYFDNSVDRWESDCKYDISHGCSIAGSMYIRGNYEDANTGKIVKISGSKKERMKKAEKLLKKGCSLGSKKACMEYKKYFK